VAGVSAQSRAKNGFAATLKRGHWEKTLPRAGKQEVKKMLNKLLIAGIAGAAFVAIGASTVNAQPANCAGINTVALIKDAGSCQISDKIFSDFSFTNIPDSWSWSVVRETPPSGDFFNVRLTPDTATFGQTFEYSYTIEIDNTDPMGAVNEFKFVGLGQVVSTAQPNVTSTKTYQLFDVDGNPVGPARVLSVTGSDNAGDNAIPAGIKKIVVTDSINGTLGTFDSLKNEFQQIRVTQNPVPASLALFGFGLVALGYQLRRKA
jgi:hypothetical protein